MTNTAIIVTIISSLISGLIGVLISFYFYNRLEKRKLKVETARKLFGNRYDINCQAFKESLNEIMLVFSDCDKVISSLEEFWNTLQTPLPSRPPNAADDNLIKLITAVRLRTE
jgi:hypothetical protein